MDYSLDCPQGEDFIVNAVSEEEAVDKVQNLLQGVAKRKGMELGSVFINFAATKETIDGER